MSKILFLVLLSLTTHLSVSAAPETERIWESSDLPSPESIVFDQKRDVLYVSLQAYGAKPGSGSIGKLSPEGKIISKVWVSGLTEPKGMVLFEGKLFVSDVKELIEVDIESGKIVKKYQAPGPNFLNDVAINAEGEIFVSDMFNSSIYKLDKERKFSLWLESPALENPNGLLVQGDNLLVASWGSFSNQKPLTAKKGNIISVSMASKKITRLTSSPVGNLDGIQAYQQNKLLVSDWVDGSVTYIDEKFSSQLILKLEQSVGDIAWLEEKGILLVPLAKQGKIVAFKLKK